MKNIIETIDAFLAAYSSATWGLPTLLLLIGGGLYLLIRSRFLPFRYLKHAIQVTRGKYDDPNDPGEISHFQALTTALSATIGMGNIAGVAVAISIGGPGAIFWMWVTGIVGMSTKFFTSTLAIMYRGKDSKGELQGGPMYFITEGLEKSWKPMAVFFSLAGLIGALPIFNVNQLTEALRETFLRPNDALLQFSSLSPEMSTNLVIGLTLALITSIVILGGLKRISKTASRLVPAMVVLYFFAVVAILIINIEQVPHYLAMIFTDAFTGESYAASAAAGNSDAKPFLGGMLGGLILLGVKRGAFSNEAGIGTAPMAHGAAKTKQPVREGLVAMLGPLIDTLIVCTLTALTILVSGVYEASIGQEVQGVAFTSEAFGNSIPIYGPYILLICVAVFSISSLFSYSYYGTKCMSFLLGAEHKHWYNYFYILSIVVGATFPLDSMLNLIDGTFALMAFPTMIATLIMAPRVMREARKYFAELKE